MVTLFIIVNRWGSAKGRKLITVNIVIGLRHRTLRWTSQEQKEVLAMSEREFVYEI